MDFSAQTDNDELLAAQTTMLDAIFAAEAEEAAAEVAAVAAPGGAAETDAA